MVAARRSVARVLSQTQSSLYICRSCRNQLSRPGLSIPQQRFASNLQDEPRTTEAAQQKRWNTESSSGLKDSYGGPGFQEKRQAPKIAEVGTDEVLNNNEVEQTGQAILEVQPQESQPLVPKRPVKAYEPAEDWEGLQFVGSRGNWRDVPATPDDEFSTWLDPESRIASTRQELVSCLQQALEEHESEMLASSGDIHTEDAFLEMKLDMEDPLTFNILKRFSQLSGHRIPDPTLNLLFSSNKSLSFLIDQLFEKVVQPKPTKIADILMSDPALSRQSNVLIFPRRETSIDKEKEVGRWKVIEQELRSRGLPVTGKVKRL